MKPALKLNFPFQRSVACQRCVRRRYYANLLHDTGLEGSSYFLPVPSPKPFASWTQLSYLSLKKKINLRDVSIPELQACSQLVLGLQSGILPPRDPVDTVRPQTEEQICGQITSSRFCLTITVF